MSEVIKPITHFNSTKEMASLAVRIMNLVHDPSVRKMLEQRHLTGVLERYPKSKDAKLDSEAAFRRVQHARANHREGVIGAYVVLAASGTIIGMATVIPKLRLRRHKTPVPRPISKGPLRENFSPIGPEVTVWTNEVKKPGRNISKLGEAYSAMLAEGGPVDMIMNLVQKPQPKEKPNSWTIEPLRAPEWIHVAIHASGMEPRGNARYDDAEPGLLAFPVSTLYSVRPVS